jgi:hypothetical protein
MADQRPNRVFVSLRFNEARKEGALLKSELEKRGIPTFLSSTRSGDDIREDIIENLDKCELVVILGTESFGTKTASRFSTFEELRFIIDEPKNFFLVKMCDRFSVVSTRFFLPSSVAYTLWKLGEDLPSNIVPEILEKLHAISSRANPTIVPRANGNPLSPGPNPAEKLGDPLAPSTLSAITLNDPTELHLPKGHSHGVSPSDLTAPAKALQAPAPKALVDETDLVSLSAKEICALMHSRFDDSALQEQAFLALWKLAKKSDAAKDEILEHASVLTFIISKHAASILILHAAFTCLSAICPTEHGKAILATADAIEAIMCGMRAHPEEATLVQNGCFVLSFVADASSSRATAAREGAVAFALDALRAHLSQASVQRSCNRLLAALSGDEANRLAVIKSPRGVAAIVAGMAKHPQHLDVQRYGCRALVFLGSNSEAINQARTAGATRVVIAAMREHSQNADLMSRGCQELSLLADEKSANKVEVAKNGGLDAVAMAINIHLASADVVKFGCRAIWTIDCEDNHSLVTSIKGAQLVVDAMAKHASVREVQVYGIRALAVLALDATNRSLAVDSGAIEAIVAAMRLFMSNSDIQFWGCTGLLHIASKSSSLTATRGRIEGQAGKKLVRDAMVAFVDHMGIQKVGNELLLALSS